MRSYGISKSAAEAEFRIALKLGYSTGRLSPSRELRPITQLADVCSRWHLEKRFVKRDGTPRPLTWNGKSGTLLKLVSLVVGPKQARQVAENLVVRKLVKKAAQNAWIPKSRVVSPAGFDHAQTLRTATMMERLLRTIAYNSRLKYRGAVLLEVMAQVKGLPGNDIPQFKKLAKSQGLMFAKTIDDWLESRNVPRSKRSRVKPHEAGVVAFAFHHPNKERP